jgi:hypothetical protein
MLGTSQGPFEEKTIIFPGFPLGLSLDERIGESPDECNVYISKIKINSAAYRRIPQGAGLSKISNTNVKNVDKDRLSKIFQHLQTLNRPIPMTFIVTLNKSSPLTEPYSEIPNVPLTSDQQAVTEEPQNMPFPVTSFLRPLTAVKRMDVTNLNANDVINANDLKKRIINIDSRFRSAKISPQSNFMFRLDTPLKNVIRIKLASLEFPKPAYYDFSKNKYNTTFIIETASDSYEFIIQEGNYTIPQMFNELNRAFAQVTDASFSAAYNEITQQTDISGTQPFTLQFAHTNPERIYDFGLGYYLGFRLKEYSGASLYTSESRVDITGDPYCFLQINQFSNVEQKLLDGTILNAFAKITKYNENQALTKEIILQQPTNFSYFDIRVVDPYGQEVDMLDCNFSFALEVTEVMNSELYDFYRNYLFQKTLGF